VTQSTLSHQIKQLEEELGMPLFDRSGKHVRMTEAGEILRSHMTPALEKIDLGCRRCARPGEAITGSIRLGTTPSFNTRMVPLCVATLLNAYPGIAGERRGAGRGADPQAPALRPPGPRVSYPPAEGSDLWFEALYKEELRLVVASATRWRAGAACAWWNCTTCAWCCCPRSSSPASCSTNASSRPARSPWWWRSSIRSRHDRADPADRPGGIITETAVAQTTDLRVIPLEDPTPVRTPGLLWPKGASRSPVLRHFTEIIRRAAGTAA
jgi:LysR family cyn operon transcriptional activator